MMRASETATMTDRKPAVGRPTAGALAAAAPVLVAVWCRSVETSWTLELHELDGGAASKIVDWISSGVPISQPEPDALACELLAERGLHLFRDPSAGPWTRSRYGIGYVCRNADLIELAHVLRDHATETGVHPVVLAAQWVAAGFSAEAAARWIREGAHSPQAAQVSSELTVSPTHTVRSQGTDRLSLETFPEPVAFSWTHSSCWTAPCTTKTNTQTGQRCLVTMSSR
jgi:hypothetical protein